MYVFDVEDTIALKESVVEQLKYKGVRWRLPKKPKEEKDVIYDQHTFEKPLHMLTKSIVPLCNGAAIKVPMFVVDACDIIMRNLDVEGLFRKAGSSNKQQEMKIELDSGKMLSSGDHQCINVCSIVKRFFRDLPQPILPYEYHELLLKCLLLSPLEKQVDSLLLSCLLLPVENIATLAYFLECLLKVSTHSHKNKMDIKNLAIVLTPTLMPVADKGKISNNLKITHHIKVIELLIEHAHEVGQVPQSVRDCIRLSTRKSRKKRRSGSITRMLSGLKKMVGPRGSSTPEWDNNMDTSTNSSLSSPRKRKAAHVTDNELSAKKRLQDESPFSTPLMSRMNSYSLPVPGHSHPVPANLKRVRSRSPRSSRGQRKLLDSFRAVQDAAPRNQSKSVKKQKSATQLFPRNETNRIERTLSSIFGVKKKATRSNLFLNRSNPDYETETEEAMEMEYFSITAEAEREVEESEPDIITIPRSEYEEIKNRVSVLESCISQELGNQMARSVQNVYKKTLEESERLSAEDNLAGRLNRELKIRRSLDNKIIRSPSARKIGSIRRRSKELVQKNLEKLCRSESMQSQAGAKSTLKRGRPNTLQTGLPSPRSLRAASSLDLTVEPERHPRCSVKRSTSLTVQATQPGSSDVPDQWYSGEKVFTQQMLVKRLLSESQGRPSIADIRKHKAGMVLEKTKLFNSLNQSEDSQDGTTKHAAPRRQSVRLENMRRSPKKIGTLRHNPLVGRNIFRSPELGAKENDQVMDQSSPGIKDMNVNTPLPLREANRSLKAHAQVPSIKKKLGTRSPRQFAKTPMSAMRLQSRSRPTPLKALVDPFGTPRRTPRRSPRILARTVLSQSGG